MALPEAVALGTITGHWTLVEADENGATETGLNATVILKPRNPSVQFPGEDINTLLQPQRCPVIDGDLYPPGTIGGGSMPEPGVQVLASIQAEGVPETIQWELTLHAPGAPALARRIIEVPPGGTVDASDATPITPEGATIPVATRADALAAQQAAITALAAAGDAEAAAILAQAGTSPEALAAAIEAYFLANPVGTGTVTKVNDVEPDEHGHVELEPSDIGAQPAATGTPDGTKFLRDDGTWATTPDTNTTYAEIAAEAITDPDSSTAGLVSGRRVAAAIAGKLDASDLDTAATALVADDETPSALRDELDATYQPVGEYVDEAAVATAVAPMTPLTGTVYVIFADSDTTFPARSTVPAGYAGPVLWDSAAYPGHPANPGDKEVGDRRKRRPA